MITAEIMLWGSRIGALAWDSTRNLALFEYTPEFVSSGIEVAPLTMPLQNRVYTFPELPRETFYGLPGMLADALPDKFGNLLIDEWLVRTGRTPASFSPVERLCYIGMRGMGALEFRPSIRTQLGGTEPIEVAELVKLANAAIARKSDLQTTLAPQSNNNTDGIGDILKVGTSAGGARAKAVIAWNENTNEVRSGQLKAPAGFSYWIIKFDGVSGNRDKELNDPQGFGKIEYAYNRMALAAGIDMTECRLFRENGRSHFMTRRFDRTSSGHKIHMQTLCGIAHMDFNRAGAYSYEQALDVAAKLGLKKTALAQLFKRMVFNVMARNQDDHTKNISFLMDKKGGWSLAPAYDVTYSYNPSGAWTHQHQMRINGKQDDFSREDFYMVAKHFNIGNKDSVNNTIDEIRVAINRWPVFAAEAGVPDQTANAISKTFRTISN